MQRTGPPVAGESKQPEETDIPLPTSRRIKLGWEKTGTPGATEPKPERQKIPRTQGSGGKFKKMAAAVDDLAQEAKEEFKKLRTDLEESAKKIFQSAFEEFEEWTRNGKNKVNETCQIKRDFPDPDYSPGLVIFSFTGEGWEAWIEPDTAKELSSVNGDPAFPKIINIKYELL